MNAVGGYPEDRSAFQSQGGADSQTVLDPFRGLVPAMGKQPVITHTNAQATRDPPEENCDKKSVPSKEKECRHYPGVKQAHDNSGYPIDVFIAWLLRQGLEVHDRIGERILHFGGCSAKACNPALKGFASVIS